MRIITAGIAMPDDLAAYFDTHSSSLNPRNHDLQYSYGTLPLFLTRFVGEWLDGACAESPSALRVAAASLVAGEQLDHCTPGTFTGFKSALVGRMLSAIVDLGTIVLVYLLAREMRDRYTGLLAALLYAFTAFAIQQGHFFTVDSMTAFFSTAAILFAVRAAQRVHGADFALAGLMSGLAAGCKVSGGFAAIAVALAGVSVIFSKANMVRSHSALRVSLWLGVAGILAFLAFRTVQPYAFEGPGFLGLRLSSEWFHRLGQISAEQGGKLDYPSGRQWANRPAIIFPWVNMVVWGMGLPLGLAAWAGWALAGYDILRGKLDSLVLWGWVSLIFIYQSIQWVKAMRYFLPLYPALIALAACALLRLVRHSSKWRRVLGAVAVAMTALGTILWGYAAFSIYLRPHTRVAASRWIYEHVPSGLTVANEHWDWGLPLRIDGHDPFGGMYSGIQMENYNEDTEEKREQLYGWLDQADYIFLASNRLYASIPRLPARYPLTTAYYRYLFSGQLGFKLAADFTSYPALGPFQFPDQETPFALVQPDYRYQHQPITVNLPPAEESLSVYDHPRVLIFEKTPDYSQSHVEELLGPIDVTRALHGLKAVQASVAPNLIAFDESTWADQEAGGTWSEMFNRQSPVNRWPGLSAAAWWLTIAVLGWAAFPVLFVAVPGLHDRGYGLAKILGLLLIAYATWLSASLRVLPNTRGTIAGVTALLLLVGGGVGWWNRKPLCSFLRKNWRMVLIYELTFAALYVLWIGVRMLNPDLWHPVVGGEKPMDFAYFNAVMKSTWFPPYNPWFSGTPINYYYFGFVIVGSLTKLVGTIPAVAYNLAIPLVYALTGCGAFSVAYNLVSRGSRQRVVAGFFSMVCTVLLGNLGVVHLVRSRLIELGGDLFPSTIPGYPETIAALRGLWLVIAHGARLGFRPETWYWHPTRIIPAVQGEPGPITEFPVFTFLYGDLHAHMIALPLTLLALALAVHWARSRKAGLLSLILGGLVVGALWPTNSWDYPTYLLVGVAALGFSAWRNQPSSEDALARARVFAVNALALWALTKVAFLPYLQNYAKGYTSLTLWHGSQTPADIYLWIHGIVLLPVVTYLVLCAADGIKRVRYRRATVATLVTVAALLAVAAPATLADILTVPPVAVIVVPLGLVSAWCILSPGVSTERRLFFFLIGTSMALSLAVELVVLSGDIGRMNTVFKFYLQVWVMLSVAAGVSFAWLVERSRRWQHEWRVLWGIALGLLVAGGALFIPLGVRARAVDRMSPEVGMTLDGMAFMEYASVYDGDPRAGGPQEIMLRGDYNAIKWIQDNVKGSPVIIEGLGHREYLWANRVSIYTGLPTVIGWRWHEVQQRAALPDQMVRWRRDDVNTFYNTDDVRIAACTLQRYGVRYVYVGPYEKAYYSSDGLAKFQEMAQRGLLHLVYNAVGVEIYEVVNQ